MSMQLSVFALLVGSISSPMLPSDISTDTHSKADTQRRLVTEELLTSASASLATTYDDANKPLELPTLELWPAFGWMADVWSLGADLGACASSGAGELSVQCHTISWAKRLGEILRNPLGVISAGASKWKELIDKQAAPSHERSTTAPMRRLEDNDYLTSYVPRSNSPFGQQCLSVGAMLSSCAKPWSRFQCRLRTPNLGPTLTRSRDQALNPYNWDRQACLRLDESPSSRS